MTLGLEIPERFAEMFASQHAYSLLPALPGSYTFPLNTYHGIREKGSRRFSPLESCRPMTSRICLPNGMGATAYGKTLMHVLKNVA